MEPGCRSPGVQELRSPGVQECWSQCPMHASRREEEEGRAKRREAQMRRDLCTSARWRNTVRPFYTEMLSTHDPGEEAAEPEMFARAEGTPPFFSVALACCTFSCKP